MSVIIRHKVLYPVIILVIFIATAHAGEFKVFKIYDGDSFAARGHDIEIKVRLMGIDAPEMGRGGARATIFTRSQGASERPCSCKDG